MTLVPEVKKPPPPVTKEPNTGQTIHPPDTPDNIETLPKTELIEKKENGPARVKGKRKPSKQQKKEEKARKKDKGRGDKEREKDKERDADKTDAKQRTGSLGDSSSSNSTDQLEAESPPPPVENTLPSPKPNVKSNQVTDDEPVNKQSVIENDASVLSIENKEVPIENKEVPPVVPAVPSTAIKTGRAKRQTSKEGPTPDPFSRVPDRSTYSAKKNSTTSKKPSPPEKAKQLVAPKNTSPSVEVNSELPLPPETEEVVCKPRPQTLPVIVKTEAIEEPILELPIDSDYLVETDGVSQQTLLSVDSSKSGSQSLPTSPHELAASLLSNNSAIKKRRKQKSDFDKPGDDLDDDDDEDEQQQHEEDEHIETKILKPIEPQLSRKVDYASHDQFKCLSTLSLNAEPFYPSPATCGPKSGTNSRGDPRKYGHDRAPRLRGLPPGVSPTPDDPYMRPYPDGPYFKRPHPSRGGKSMTPSPPLPYFTEGPPMPYGDYPPLDQDPMLTDESPYGGPEDFPPMPMGRHSRDYYRGHSPMMVPKDGMGRRGVHPSMEAYMHHLYMQQRAREYGYRPQAPWEHPPSRRSKPYPADEILHHERQYLKKRHYIMRLIEKERAIADMERKQTKHSIDTPSPGNFEPDTSPSFETIGWDNPVIRDPPPAENTEQIRYRPSRLLPDKPSPPAENTEQIRYRPSRLLPDKPLRRRTYSTESDLGGEFVTDFPVASSVGAPGQQFSSRGNKGATVSAGGKDLAPGRSQSAGWPEGTQVRDTQSFIFSIHVCTVYVVVVRVHENNIIIS